jgi:hypothetical protein
MKPRRRNGAAPLATLAWFTLGSLLSLPASASAFSDPIKFGLTTLAGGGGGRYFTGSPADGYTCKVCHEGGPEPKLSVVGLPLGGYRPGFRYEVVVGWPPMVEKFSAAVEFTDTQGKPAGSLRLPPDGEVDAAEYCEPASVGILAASITDAPNARRVISLPDCGSRRLRFLWTAPPTDVGPVWFAGSSVWSDGEDDAYHDGVTDFGRVIASPSSPALVSMVTDGCSVSAAPSHGTHGAWAFGGCLVLLALRRLRLRARISLVTQNDACGRETLGVGQVRRPQGR